MEIEHFSHIHPLILSEEQKNGDEKVSCYGCLQTISSAFYSCTQCKFNLHKSCAELPMKIIHFMHPKHPLTLVGGSAFVDEFGACGDCDEKIWGFTYHCYLCAFGLDLKCALQLQLVEYGGHEHSFMLHGPDGSFSCDACGKRGNGKSYFCTTCQLWVHISCALCPPTIKHIGHDHPLSLTHILLFDDFWECFCKVCGEMMDKFHWGYYCGSCPYLAHLECVTADHLMEEYMIMQDVDDNEPDPALNMLSAYNDDIVGLMIQDVNEMSLTEKERVTELQHFSHDHSLTLSNELSLTLSNDDEPKNEEICDACVESISVPFYKCSQCNFFLHASCAELPYTILHPLHPHPLNILAKEDGVFQCDACAIWSNGFTYFCPSCKFFLDVKCTLFSDTLRHEAHEHTLNLFQQETISVCDACRRRCDTKFRCEECNFDLDLQCASLPFEARHRWDEAHPLKLTYCSVEDKYGEYYCDLCEERRDMNSWFYNCKDCDLSAHPKCLLGIDRIKYGKTWKRPDHPHLLTLVKNIKCPICDICGHPCNHWSLECADCNIYIHVQGFCVRDGPI